MARLVIGFIGYSNSGKTTLVSRLVARYVAEGAKVGVLKHTHHKANTERRGGDTDCFLSSGASGAILADDRTAVLWVPEADSPAGIFPYERPLELVDALQCEVVFIEGFKKVKDWPRVVVDREGAEMLVAEPGSFIATVSDRPEAHGGRIFAPNDVEAIAAYIESYGR